MRLRQMKPRADPVADLSWRAIRLWMMVLGRRRLSLVVDGLEHVPSTGPAIIAAHHFHHLYDGCTLMMAISRPLHFLVALDWTEGRRQRHLMEVACAMARWPVILRDDALEARLSLPRVPVVEPERIPVGPDATPARTPSRLPEYSSPRRIGSRSASLPARGSVAGKIPASAFEATESYRYLRRAFAEEVAILQAGRLMVIFPEGYPYVDPIYTPKTDPATILPFRPGFARLAARVQRETDSSIPVIPAGFVYETAGPRWQVRLRFGAPLFLDQGRDVDHLIHATESSVRTLAVGGVSPSDSGAVVESGQAPV